MRNSSKRNPILLSGHQRREISKILWFEVLRHNACFWPLSWWIIWPLKSAPRISSVGGITSAVSSGMIVDQDRLLLTSSCTQPVLHVCGSAILMGRLCTFEKGEIPSDSLCRSWTLCLQHLSSYEKLSKIARKSSHLLQESARRLVKVQHMQASYMAPARQLSHC